MKKLLLLLLLINISFIGFSQYKGNPAKARSLLDKSALKSNESEIRELLINAKGEIDAAILLDKQKQKPNTWLIRGDVYAAIAKGYSDIDSEAIEKSIEAYDKIGTEVPTKDFNIIQNMTAGRQNLSSHFVNNAIISLQGTGEPDYESAYDAFSNSLRVNPNDTLGLLYGGYVSEQLQKYDVALSYYDRLMSMNILNDKNTNTIFQNSINILYKNCDLFTECESYERTLGLIEKAKVLFPDNNYYPSVEINIAMQLDKVEEARIKIDEQLSMDPENPSLHFNRAVLYYNLGLALSERNDFSEKEKLDTMDIVYKSSIESYKTTLQFDPNNDRAVLYLLDAYKANAKPYYDLERNLDFLALKNKYQSESDRLKNEGNSRISEAKDYAQSYMDMKGEEISNEDIATIYPIFSILEDYDNLIQVLSISISRDNTNIEYLEVLRGAYMKKKDYENAERIYQMILALE
ncbi:MAG: hypothetical protein VX706_04135 [Bacteroidota bacterium]|nr:hypothetical protein [Bacteroidota bacterium]